MTGENNAENKLGVVMIEKLEEGYSSDQSQSDEDEEEFVDHLSYSYK